MCGWETSSAGHISRWQRQAFQTGLSGQQSGWSYGSGNLQQADTELAAFILLPSWAKKASLASKIRAMFHLCLGGWLPLLFVSPVGTCVCSTHQGKLRSPFQSKNTHILLVYNCVQARSLGLVFWTVKLSSNAKTRILCFSGIRLWGPVGMGSHGSVPLQEGTSSLPATHWCLELCDL